MSARTVAETRATRRIGLVFALFLVLLLVGFLFMSPSYPPRSRLFPLLVAVPTLACMLLVLLSYVSPTADRLVTAFDAAFFDTDSELFETDADELETGRISRALGWAIATLVAFYLFGFVLTTFGFMFAYLSIEGEHGRGESLLLAVITTAAMYGLFVALFGVRLGGGLVPNLVFGTLGL